MKTRTAERAQFLADVLATAVEHNGYGFFDVTEWHWADEIDPSEWFATIVDSEDDSPTWRLDIETMAEGLGVIRRAIPATDDDGTYLVNAETFERLEYGGRSRDQLLLADRTNGDDGDVDVISALAVLECALFGRVVYA